MAAPAAAPYSPTFRKPSTIRTAVFHALVAYSMALAGLRARRRHSNIGAARRQARSARSR